MKHYIVSYHHNYGTSVMFVNALSAEEAMIFASIDGAWEDMEVTEIDLDFRGVTYISD